MGAQIVSLCHISPAANVDFQRVTSPKLERIGTSVSEAWKTLVKPEGRFISVSIEDLFGQITAARLPKMKAWLKYINERYAWLSAPQPVKVLEQPSPDDNEDFG
jgi:hypothetical protein